MENVLGLALSVGILVAITWFSIRSASRASAERGWCGPCRLDEGVGQQVPNVNGGGLWRWVSPTCCENDGKRRSRPRRQR